MIIKYPEIEAALTDTGISKLPNAGESILKRFNELYTVYVVPELTAGQTHWSMSSRKKDLVKFLNDEIIAVFRPYLEQYFDEFRPIVSSFMAKPPHTPEVEFHQDWTFVDNEPEANSYTCWIPLVDIDSNNGPMGFILGSHKQFSRFRGSPSPPVGHQFPINDESLLKSVEYFDLKAGEPVVFNHRIIHGSLPNTTGNHRPAIGVAFTSKHHRLVHFFRKPDTTEPRFTKYAIDEDFFGKYSNLELSDLYKQGSSISDYEVMEDNVLIN